MSSIFDTSLGGMGPTITASFIELEKSLTNVIILYIYHISISDIQEWSHSLLHICLTKENTFRDIFKASRWVRPR